MKKHGLTTLIGLIGLMALPLSNARAAPAELAKEKCGECHGNDGVSHDDKVPSIAGFSAQTITDMLESYATGDRMGAKYKPEGGKETDMGEVVKALSEDDKQTLAQFFAQKKFKAHPQAVDAALAAGGAKIHEKNCEKCHSDGGTNAEDDAAILGGQWRAYLVKEFDQLTSGERPMPDKMRKRFEKLSDEEKKQLIEYYAGGGGKK